MSPYPIPPTPQTRKPPTDAMMAKHIQNLSSFTSDIAKTQLKKVMAMQLGLIQTSDQMSSEVEAELYAYIERFQQAQALR